jgi:hypothetical protein
METLRISLEEYNKLVSYQEKFNSLYDYNSLLIHKNKELKQELDIIKQTNDILRMKNNSLLNEISSLQKDIKNVNSSTNLTLQLTLIKDEYVSIQRYV